MPERLAGIYKNTLDGGLRIIKTNASPIVLVIGTASKGPSEAIYSVARVQDAVNTFGKSGTLVRGLYEASIGGAENIRLVRIGASAATLSGIGDGTGWTVETVVQDDSAGTDYEIFFDASEERLRIYRASDDEVVYDNNPTYPLEAIDLGEVSVTGSSTGSATDIGSLGTPITLAAADTVGDGPAVYTAGADGLNPSRIEMWEALHDIYGLLESQEADVVSPMAVFLDDLNIMDLTAAEITTRALTSISTYPSALATNDVLGKVFVQEFEGKEYFWWWFPSDTDADVDATFTSDSGANIFPTAGSASATVDTLGTALTGSDFHEVNFAWQLANFCYIQSRDNDSMGAVIGVNPPNSFSYRDVAIWVGTPPVLSTDAAGNSVVATNGTGLLGNKFMNGRIASGGVPGYTIDGIAGRAGGGFIATSADEFLDNGQLKDDNDYLIDIGKYLSVVATYSLMSNPSSISSYYASGATTYGGFYSVLAPQSAPTNKLLTSVRLGYRLSKAKLLQLATAKYVTFHQKTRGIVVTDAPTAARIQSDYQRLSTKRQVEATVTSLRQAAEPFLGEGMAGETLAALETALDSRLKGKVKDKTITRYDFTLTSTVQQRILGQATLELKLTPAFELREVTIVVALAAV